MPPYNVLVIPYGPSPLSSNVEVRSIIDVSFKGNSTFEFPINYPANSKFVVVVSDATGFGSGGTSAAMHVMNSNDASCFDPTKQASTLFSYYVSPDTLRQCQQARIWWKKADVQGRPVFHGVIPGGQSFSIAPSNVTHIPGMGHGFSWTPPIRSGTFVFIIGGDNRGIASAGSTPHIVRYNKDNRCLDDASPSSNAGAPAGWNHHTGIFNSKKSAWSGRVTVGLVIGGMMGGVTPIFIAALYYFIWRRRRLRSRPRLLVNGIDGDVPSSNESSHQNQSRDDLAENHHLEPFPLHPPVMRVGICATQRPGDVQGSSAQQNRPQTRELSQNNISVKLNGSKRDYGARNREHDAHASLSTIVQHGDPGPSTPPAVHCAIIEPPPAYSRIKRATQLLKILV
ncbi:hypothetical protein APHAL10511_008085 [Amanita phalloides]|nr:hypothetical protein APHAL10511_008085 [Amanita phalloides]